MILFPSLRHWNNHIGAKGKAGGLIRFNLKLSIYNQKLPKHDFQNFVLYF
jgi:hypothetical protein